ncbi:MAG: ABC transporter ATP-binding protein [Candidatus Hodarchaeales archaeon]|jgi:putative ABC transport system ATP-binding protein
MDLTATVPEKNSTIIDSRNLKKSYYLGSAEVNALSGVDLQVHRGEFLIIMGPSGSGKTTLLNLLGGIDKVTDGKISYFVSERKKKSKGIKETDITKLSDPKLTSFRRAYLSYIFQFYSLIPTLTAKENVQLMAELVYKGKRLNEQSEHWLSVVGLGQRMDNFPGQLSGGERQRVAIARAIAKEPEILFCDEPTGQLDQVNGKQVVDVLSNVCKTTNTTILMVTHDPVYKPYADRVLFLEDGKISGEEN